MKIATIPSTKCLKDIALYFLPPAAGFSSFAALSYAGSGMFETASTMNAKAKMPIAMKSAGFAFAIVLAASFVPIR